MNARDDEMTESTPRLRTTHWRTIAAITNALNTIDKMMCIVSLKPVPMFRELIAHVVWVGNPTTPIATRDHRLWSPGCRGRTVELGGARWFAVGRRHRSRELSWRSRAERS